MFARVTLYTYDLGKGAYHAGVEVYGIEYAFSNNGIYTSHKPGVWNKYRPTHAEAGYRSHKEDMGCTHLSKDNVEQLIQSMRTSWPEGTYSLVEQNCCHFARRLLEELGANAMPMWVDAYTGSLAPVVEAGIVRGSVGFVTPVVERRFILAAGETATGAVMGPAAWAAFAGDLAGTYIGDNVGRRIGGGSGSDVGANIGGATGSVGSGAIVGGICAGPVGAGAGALIGGTTWLGGKCIEYFLHGVSSARLSHASSDASDAVSSRR